MTISNDTCRVEVVGNGATTVFDYDFIIPSQADAQLWLIDTSVTPNTQSLILSSAWTMTGAGDPNGGTFTYPTSGSPISSDYSLILERTVPYTQPFAFKNQGAYYPRNVESALDWLEMQIQQLLRGLGSTIQISLGNGATIVPVPNSFLYFDSNGDLTTLSLADLIDLLITGGLIDALINAGLVNSLINNGLVTALDPYFGGGGSTSGPYDLNFDYGQDTIPSATRLQFTIPNGRSVAIGADFLDSSCTVGTNPSDGDAVFEFKQGLAGSDTLLGTLTIDTGGGVTWATDGGTAKTVTGGVGKYVYCDSPSPADSTAAGIAFTIKGTVS